MPDQSKFASSTTELLLGRQEGSILVAYVSGLGKGARRPAYFRIDLLCCSVSPHLKGTWETHNHQAFCVSLVLVSFSLIYRAAYPLLVKHSTINLSLTSEKNLTDSKLPDTGYLRTKGQESVYETCACVIHTMFYSATCAFNTVSHFTLMLICAGYMCFVKL